MCISQQVDACGSADLGSPQAKRFVLHLDPKDASSLGTSITACPLRIDGVCRTLIYLHEDSVRPLWTVGKKNAHVVEFELKLNALHSLGYDDV